MLAVLPALGHLHRSGLLFCDFKPDNVIRTQDSLKLIDLGGVYRIDDPAARSTGRRATRRRRSRAGPVGRRPTSTRSRARSMLLCIDFKGYQSDLRPQPARPRTSSRSSPSSTRSTGCCEGDRARSRRPLPDGGGDGRSARRRPARGRRAPTAGTPGPRPSTLFSGDFRRAARRPDWRAAARAAGRHRRPGGRLSRDARRHRPRRARRPPARGARPTVEVRAAADARADRGGRAGRGRRAHRARSRRTTRGSGGSSGTARLAELARGRPRARGAVFPSVYRAVPGELAPKLALARRPSRRRSTPRAAGWYERCRASIAASPRRRSGWPAAASRSATGPARWTAYDARRGELEHLHRVARSRRIHCLIAAQRRAGPVADLVTADAACAA